MKKPLNNITNSLDKNYFRGKSSSNGYWYYGAYLHLSKTTYCFTSDYDFYPDNDIHQIVFQRMTDWGLPNQTFVVDVDPETIGQYTGRKDKNKMQIFEGDLVTVKTKFGKDIGIVVFHEGKFCIYWDSANNYPKNGHICSYYDINSRTEVLGNIYDNSELIGGKNQ